MEGREGVVLHTMAKKRATWKRRRGEGSEVNGLMFFFSRWKLYKCRVSRMQSLSLMHMGKTLLYKLILKPLKVCQLKAGRLNIVLG